MSQSTDKKNNFYRLIGKFDSSKEEELYNLLEN